MAKINVAFAGGSCTGKSTLAALLFAHLKIAGFDYDLIGEEHRKIKTEFGNYQSPFERFYMWRQQEREELRSTASDGFITDSPLFAFYAGAKLYSEEPRDQLAVRELFRMCLEVKDRYQLIVVAENPEEIPYRTDGCRKAGKKHALARHAVIRSFLDHFLPEKLLLVKGDLETRCAVVESKLKEMRL